MSRAMLTWTALLVVGVIASFLISFVVATLPARLSWAMAVRADLAAWLILFGVLGAIAVLGAGRIAFGAWPPARPSDRWLVGIGLGIAAAEEILLHEWAETSLGYYSWQFVGPTAGLSVALVLLSIALFGVRVAPAGASGPPRLAVAISGVGVVAVVLSNLPDLRDGIGGGGGVAVAIGLAGLYGIGAVVLALISSR